MKNLLCIAFLLFTGVSVFSQTDGLSYQAVIINPSAQEIPGVDASGNILVNANLDIRFTIVDEVNGLEYQEVQSTQTDAFGMINLIIGQGQPSSENSFTAIVWDGNRKDLQVEVSFDGSYIELSKEPLTFIPYAFHRDIIATGDLSVDGGVLFRGDFEVDGTTQLNNTVSVTNESDTFLSGTLTVDGRTLLNNALTVENESPTALTGELNVDGVTNLFNTLQVEDATNLNDELNVQGPTTLNNMLLVTGENTTNLSGDLTVDGETNLNSDVFINNGSSLLVSGDFEVAGNTVFDSDLTVNGITNLNNSLRVNNESPTELSGLLSVGGQTILNEELQVLGATQLEDALGVANASPTVLSGTLTADGQTNLNSGLNVNNGSPTNLSGSLNVAGLVEIGDNLTVNGTTNLNDQLNVNNAAPTSLSGTLTVDEATQLNNTLNVVQATTLQSSLDVLNDSPTNLAGTLEVEQATTLNSTLDVANGSATNLTGTLDVDNITTLNSNLTVANASDTQLTGELLVDGPTSLNNTLSVLNGQTTALSGVLTVGGATTLNNSLEVANGSPTALTGTLTVDEPTTLKNSLTVSDASPTLLTGTLEVLGATNLQNDVIIAGATTINNSLTVTGNTSLGQIASSSINIQSDSPTFVATFENTNADNGDGILIKLGKTHPAWNGSGYVTLSQPASDLLAPAVAVVQSKLNNPSGGPFLTVNDIISMVPTAAATGAAVGIANTITGEINSRLGLPINFPAVTVPQTTLLNGFPVFDGVTVPVVDITIPGFSVPDVVLPQIPILPSFPIIPAIPSIPINGLDVANFTGLPTTDVTGSLTQENAFLTFKDSNGFYAGAVRAQSITDFRANTIMDNIYVLNVASDFVGVDLLDGVTSGIVAISNLYDEFNHLGVEYASGNGDYAEWLERANATEYITPGDIVGIVGGKISRDLSEFEQIMVVSHHPIILGNTPEKEHTHLGNNVAFMGQVPVKIMGPVNTGDFIVAHPELKGYGIGKSPSEMTSEDFTKTVGRSWEQNLKPGPKTINTVVGVHNGDWVSVIQKLNEKQQQYEQKFKAMEAQVDRLDQKAEALLNTNQH